MKGEGEQHVEEAKPTSASKKPRKSQKTAKDAINSESKVDDSKVRDVEDSVGLTAYSESLHPFCSSRSRDMLHTHAHAHAFSSKSNELGLIVYTERFKACHRSQGVGGCTRRKPLRSTILADEGGARIPP